MEISQITGAGKDPVARIEEDKQLKNIGAIPAVQPVKKDEDEKQSIPEPQEAPSFDHLRHDPLQLLLRAINTRLTQTYGSTNASRHPASAVEQKFTPEIVSARVAVIYGTAFQRLKTQLVDSDHETLLGTFLHSANIILLESDHETREVLRNLNLLDASVATQIEQAISLIQAALTRFTG